MLTRPQRTMNCISEQASTTRRSAGIPFLVTGLLAADAAWPSWDVVMNRLIEMATTQPQTSQTDGDNLPQVHALNSLREVFKNASLNSLGRKSETLISQCFELAADSLRSEM